MVDSIWVRTTCVERAWHGGCDRSVATCNQNQVDAIINSLNRIIAKVNACDLRGLEDLKNCIVRADENVVWKCDPRTDLFGITSGNEITITALSFSSSTARLEAVIFHEIIHACGGTELDSEAFENHCYRGAGATAPTSDDFPKFRDEGGRWVNWNGSTGIVTTKDGQSLSVTGFVDPSPPSGGSGGWI